MMGDFDIVEQREIYLVKLSDIMNEGISKLIIVPGRKELGEMLKIMGSRWYVLELITLNGVEDYYDFMNDLKIAIQPKILKEKKSKFTLDANNQVIEGGN